MLSTAMRMDHSFFSLKGIGKFSLNIFCIHYGHLSFSFSLIYLKFCESVFLYFPLKLVSIFLKFPEFIQQNVFKFQQKLIHFKNHPKFNFFKPTQIYNQTIFQKKRNRDNLLKIPGFLSGFRAVKENLEILTNQFLSVRNKFRIFSGPKRQESQENN